MAFTIKTSESIFEGNETYKNDKGNAECVVFVQQVTGLPSTTLWKQGVKVLGQKPNAIARGIAIAPFDKDGNYPLMERHTAISLAYEDHGI